MSSYIVKQPNGLYARFSTTVDTVTHVNMTREHYIKIKVAEATVRAIEELDNPKPFECIIEDFVPSNHTVKEFNKMLDLMGSNKRVR